MAPCFSTCTVLVINLFAIIVTMTACLVLPGWMLSRSKDFNIKPVDYYGCNFNRAAIVSLSIAILTCITLVIYYIVLCLSTETGGYFAGAAVFMGLLTFLFSICYSNSMKSTLGTMKDLVRAAQIEWTVNISYKDRHYQYNYRDWGHFYEECATDHGQDPSQEPPSGLPTYEINHCIGLRFSGKAVKYLDDIQLFIYVSIATWAFLLFFVNGQPIRTLRVLILLTFTVSLCALPIYASALYNRDLQRIIIESSGSKQIFKNLLGISWATTILLVLGVILTAVTDIGVGPVLIVLGLIIEIANVVMIGKLTRKGMKKLMREYYDLTLTGIPHYMLFALFLLVLVISVCQSVRKDGGCFPAGATPYKENKKSFSSSSSSSSSSSVSISTSSLSSSEIRRRNQGCA